jgi:iron complex outermembrane recepter protein
MKPTAQTVTAAKPIPQSEWRAVFKTLKKPNWGGATLMRTTVAAAVACLTLTGLTLADNARASIKKTTAIAPQPLRPALQTLSQQRDIHLIYLSEDVDARQTSGVAGDLTIDQALTQLLSGTGLSYQYIDDETVSVVPMQSTSGPAATASQSSSGIWERFRLAQTEGAPSGGGAQSGDSAANRTAENATQIEEIIVTAQKREERLQDVPVPVSTLSGASLTSSNQLAIQDYYARVPGLSLRLTGDSDSAPSVAIRGITSVGNTNPTTGIVIDEVPYGGTVGGSTPPSAPDIDPGDLARMEILRGPQGTLYGAASMGGLIKHVTIDPSMDGVGGRLQAGVSSISNGDVGQQLRVSINLPVNDTLAVRASGFTLEDPGYVDNPQTGQRDINSRDSNGGRLSALWSPSEDFSLKLSALWQRIERNGTSAVDVSLGTGFNRNAVPGTGIYDRETQAYSATMTGRWGKIDWISATGYSVDDIHTQLDNSAILGSILATLPGSVCSLSCGIAQPFKQPFEKFTQEFRAQIPVGERVDWLVGVFYTDEDSTVDYRYYDVNRATGEPIRELMLDARVSTYEEYALFTNVSIDLTDRFDIQLGARVSENEQTFGQSRTGPIAALFFPNPAARERPRTAASDTAFTYQVTPRFRISPDLMIYARVASGYRPGGPNSGCGVGAIPCDYDSDTTTNYEMGFKGGLFDRKLSLDASVYHIKWKDMQLESSIAVPFFFTYVDNITEAKSEGVELSVEAKPWSGMTIVAWTAWNNAEIIENIPPPQSTPAAAPIRAGSQLPFSSRFSSSLSLDQEFPVGFGMTGFAGATASYVDDRAGSIANESVFLPSYIQTDVRAGIRYGSWTLNAYANNVLDERGLLGRVPGTVSVVYIQPRLIGLSLEKTF